MTRLGAIDCGTNSIRLLIADVENGSAGGQLRDVHRETRIVRLGQGVDATGRFAPDAIARTRAALADYAEVMRTHRVERVRMVATSAARDVSNRDVFFAMTAGVLDAVVPGSIAEVRYAFAVASSKHLVTDDAMTSAAVTPPTPFAGKGSYSAGPDGTKTWAGPLHV